MTDSERVENLKAWAHWKRLGLDRVAAQVDVSKDERFESDRGFLESVEFVLSKLAAAERMAEALKRFEPGCNEPCDVGNGCILCGAREALEAWGKQKERGCEQPKN